MTTPNPKHLALRDRWLEDVVAGLLEHDDRLRPLAGAVTVRFDGGVAHADGHVPTGADRELLRETVCSLRGVYALWDGVRVGEQQVLRQQAAQRPGQERGLLVHRHEDRDAGAHRRWTST